MKLESVSRAETLRTIEREFGHGGEEAVTQFAAISEHIRAAVLLDSQRDGETQAVPVATATIARTVRQRLSPLWPELARDDKPNDLVLEELGHLARLGELMKVDSSHWVPAPRRSILVDDNTRLLIAASPLAALPARLRKAVQVVGRVRLLDTRNGPPPSTPPMQQFSDWMRCPHDQVGIWAAAFMEYCAKRMSPVEGIEGAELFLGGAWRQLNTLKHQTLGIQLCRRKVSIYGNPTNEYGLCRLHKGSDDHPQLAALTVIAKHDARRLQGAMQSSSGRGSSMKVSRDGDIAVLFVPRPLPEPEDAFLSLGWLAPEQLPADWPKRYMFSARLIPLLKSAVESLGYQLIEQTNQRGLVNA